MNDTIGPWAGVILIVDQADYDTGDHIERGSRKLLNYGWSILAK